MVAFRGALVFFLAILPLFVLLAREKFGIRFRPKLLQFSVSALLFSGLARFGVLRILSTFPISLNYFEAEAFSVFSILSAFFLMFANPLSGSVSILLFLASPQVSFAFSAFSLALMPLFREGTVKWADGVESGVNNSLKEIFRLKVPASALASVALPLTLAGIFLLAYLGTNVPFPVERELFWKVGAFFERPLGCFEPGSRGNFGIGGSFFPGYFAVFTIIFGNSVRTVYLAGALASVCCGFLAYFVSKIAFGKVPALFSAMAFLFLRKFTPAIRIDFQESSMQAFFSLLFLAILFLWWRFETDRLVALLGLVSGIGILNKLFFLHFLAAAGFSFLVLSGTAKRAIPKVPLLLVFLLAGAFPFIYYNASSGAPTAGFFGRGISNVLSPGYILPALEIRMKLMAGSLFPADSNYLLLPIQVAFLATTILLVAVMRNRPLQIVFLAGVGTFALSAFSYTRMFNQFHVSAIAPIFVVVFGSVPKLVLDFSFLDRRKTELFLSAGAVLLLAVFLFSHALPEMKRAGSLKFPTPPKGEIGRLEVSSCLWGSFATYFAGANESVLFNGSSSASCGADGTVTAFFPTKKGSYLGSIESESLETEMREFLMGCEGKGVEFTRNSTFYAKELYVRTR